MNLFPSTSLEYSVITKLQKRPYVTVELIEDLRLDRPKLSKQAVYQVIRDLRKSEIVIVASKRVSLSSIWIDRMHEFFTIAKHSYEGGKPEAATSEAFLNLEDGDSISYLFKNSHTTDIFWGHAFHILIGIMPAHEPIYLYNPHEWFLLARHETENLIIRQANDEGHPWRLYVPSKTPLDAYTKSLIPFPSLIHTDTTSYFKDNFYLNVFHDFIIEVQLDPKTQSSINEFYTTYSTWNDAAQARLNFIVSHMKGKNKLTISRNAKKATKYKNIFKKYFPMPR